VDTRIKLVAQAYNSDNTLKVLDISF